MRVKRELNMFYIEKDNKIIISDSDLERLKTTLKFYARIKDSDIKETDKEIVNGLFTDSEQYFEIKKSEILNKLKAEFDKYNFRVNDSFLISSLGFKINSDPRSLENVSALININEDVEFIDYNNEIHNLNVSELRILLLEIQKNICSLVKQKNSIKQDILNCSNLKELLEIKIEFKMMDFS